MQGAGLGKACRETHGAIEAIWGNGVTGVGELAARVPNLSLEASYVTPHLEQVNAASE